MPKRARFLVASGHSIVRKKRAAMQIARGLTGCLKIGEAAKSAVRAARNGFQHPCALHA
jgi:hypothetical protein